jgi:hypothetical protein
LVLRTAAITFTYATATALSARAGPAAAACHQVGAAQRVQRLRVRISLRSELTEPAVTVSVCHQICFQVALASSLMADSLAVACQTLLARNLALHDTRSAHLVVQRCVRMAGLLGCGLALVLGLSRDALPGLFTHDAAVTQLVAALLPVVVASQPINALAFVWDGVLFGAGGFRCAVVQAMRVCAPCCRAALVPKVANTRRCAPLRRFASIQMALCALPAVALMQLGPHALEAAPVLDKLLWVWAGLALVMGLRAASIWAPYSLRLPPFAVLRAAATPAGGAGTATKQQQQQQP